MTQSFIIVIIFGFGALMASSVFVFLFRRWANSRRLLDAPSQRSSHTQPTPVGAGLGVVIIVLIGLVTYTAIFSSNPSWGQLSVYVVGALLIAVVGWLDDIYGAPVYIRFAIQSIVATMFISGYGFWHSVFLPLYGEVSLGWLGVLLTFIWIVGLTNAYNFMDGSDGMAGGQCLVAGFGWGLFGVLTGQWIIGILGLLLMASSVGFLTHNWPPATIFMGDVGSTFLGFTFAALAVIAAQMDSRLGLVGVLLVWSFIFDASYTFLRRLLKGENVLQAHRGHLYQRLLIVGHSHRFVALLYIYLALAGLFVALVWFLRVPGGDIIVIVVIPLLALMLRFFVLRQERRVQKSAN